jgi:hypothetical protein
MNREQLKEIQELNQDPVNQHAKMMLGRAKEPIDPYSLHLIQLLVLAIDRGVAGAVDGPELTYEVLPYLWRIPPRKAFQVLVGKDHPEETMAAPFLETTTLDEALTEVVRLALP